ncbi:FxsA family protein [Pseudodonghicola xiamenensis]|uniref:Membrane protein FxsA n=1 Tax=Pseudodonghicola xiamenensis TaxID=337702 RepID=A0A8J3H640_9RHOB|nr:FxsA family protein [Pseudodonghicola xiamenensis]GHG83031.1 membrane protein FxsA [Pseudodonghicola xiamenensis]
MYLFLAFLAVPIIEIALFIQVGGLIGLWPTLAIVIFTAVLGSWLMRSQGRLAMGQLRGSFQRLDDPTEPLAHGAMILVAGVLLLTPGFFTDAMGFALLIPPVRRAVFRFARSRVSVAQFQMGGATMYRAGPQGSGAHDPFGPQGDVIDGDFTEVKPGSQPRKTPPSGWVEGPDQRRS